MNHISKALRGVADKYNGVSLIIRIIVGLIAGTALALVVPHMTWIGEFGTLFVSALKAVAPILVFVLVASALAQGNSKLDGRFGTVLFLYLFTTFLSAVVAVLTSRMFPQTISLGDAADADVVPQGLSEVVQTLLTNIVANPIQAMIDGNYICILMWACLFGLAMKGIANESSKAFLANVADGVSQVIRWVINLAPFGIMGLVFTSVSENGLAAFTEYGSLLLLLVGTMLLMVLVFGPLVIFLYLHRNPYPLVYRCFKESGLTAFFTRSSAANIPVNMQLCEKLGLDKDMYSVSIPLGATINMNGAAITITIMAMVNEFYSNGLSRGDFEALLLMLSPFAPHMVEELWEQKGFAAKYEGKMAMQCAWPEYDESKTVASSVEMAVQVSGKFKGTIIVPVDSDQNTVVEAAKASEKVAKAIAGMQIVKVIHVKNKLVNLIVKPC